MAKLAQGDGLLQQVEGPWGRATLVFHVALFAVPALTAWTSTLNATAYLPLVALPVTFAGGLVMLASPVWRATGARVAAATLLAVALEAGLALALVAAYSAQNPGWDLS